MANIEDLIQRARTIRIETKSKKNTAARIGGLLMDIVSALDEAQSLKEAQYGGIVATSADVVSDYAAKGYSGPYFYLVGSSLSSLVVYQYAGTGTPAQAFGGAAYDFSDYSEALSRLDDLGPKVSKFESEFSSVKEAVGGNIGEVLTLKKILQDGSVETASGANNRTLRADVEDYVGQQVTIGGVLYAKSGVNVYCWWSIHDENGNVLEHSDYSTTSSSIRYEDVPIAIPSGAKFLYVQGSATEGSIIPYCKITGTIERQIDAQSERIEALSDKTRIKGTDIVNSPNSTLNRFISNATGTWNGTNITDASYIFNVAEGDVYEVQANGQHSGYVHLLTEVDTSTSPQYMSGTEKIVILAGEKAIINIPQNGYMLIVRELYTTGSGDYLPAHIYKVSEVKDIAKSNQKRLNEISYAPIKYTMLASKKIVESGAVEDATSETNRTLKADVSALVGKTLYLTGVLYKIGSSPSYYKYCWYVFQDEDGNIVEKSNISTSASQRYDKEPIVVPEGSVFLYIQGSSAESSIMPSAEADINIVVRSLGNDGEGSAEKTTRTFALDYPSLNGGTGRVSTGGAAKNKFNKHTSEYIKVHNSIKIKNLGGITQNVSVYFYEKDLEFISYTSYPAPVGTDEVVVTNIPEGAVWFRVSFFVADNNVASIVGYPRFEVDIESEWGYGSDTTKEPYIEYLPFVYGVKVNIPIKIADHSYTTKTVFAYDEGLIHLPPTYRPNGKPTPLIFFIHGDAERYTYGESTFSGHMQMQQCWSDAGFAQVDLDLIPSCYNEPTIGATGGTRDDLECLSAAWEWITNHYNIDKRGFYLIGRSRGGQCVLEVLGKGGAVKLPIIAAISMAGANSMFEYSIYSTATENEWQLWCNAHGLPTTGRPSWGSSPSYAANKSFLSDTDCYNFVVNNFDLWCRKALTGWGLITKNTNSITPRDYFDNYIYPYVQANRSNTPEIEQFFEQMLATMEAKSPVPLRLDWCVGDQTQNKEYFVSTPHSYSTVFAEMLLKTPASLVEYRRWPGVDAENPYDETNPHYAENMIFYDGDLALPNGAVTSNPSKVTMEWLIWCMGKDPRYQGLDYTLPWQ